ncbi:MAG: exodeoxyribonuclease VII large subunit [Rubrivivax sp.]|nr:exodeoxyribonuclease VII large subunit [Rubrivivax sp.]
MLCGAASDRPRENPRCRVLQIAAIENPCVSTACTSVPGARPGRGPAKPEPARLWSSEPALRRRLLVADSAPAAAGAPAERAAWGVAALLQAGSDALWSRFGPVAVRGELSGYARAASGHCYFSLKDDSGLPALLRCAMFRRAALLVDFEPRDGQRVELRGRLDLYPARGELQLVVEAMQRVGQGTLYEEFLRLRARLEAAGLFDAARKRPLPRHPRRLAIVTSPGAAALRDVLTTLARRAPHVQAVIYPCPVQGSEAPPAIVRAIALAGERSAHDGTEALLLVRGGGSLEDLWAFNDERVVRAVAASVLPLVCGVGHESDVTLADLAADLRAPTPTAAAELAAPARDELLAALALMQRRLGRALLRRLQGLAQGLDQRAARLAQPSRAVAALRQRLDALAHRLARSPRPLSVGWAVRLQRAHERLGAAPAQHLARERARLDALAQRLRALDPRGVLGRGYAWVEDERGRAITAARALGAGQRIRAVWADGSARASVIDVDLDPDRHDDH